MVDFKVFVIMVYGCQKSELTLNRKKNPSFFEIKKIYGYYSSVVGMSKATKAIIGMYSLRETY